MKTLLKLPLVFAATAALLVGFSSGSLADAGFGATDATGALQDTLPAADNDLSTALNDVLANDPNTLTFAQSELNGTFDPATTGQVPCNAVFAVTTGHFTISSSGNVVLVCHGQAAAGPPQAIVLKGFLCFVPAPPGPPTGEFTNDSHVVFTPSGQVILVCHVNGSST
jgi:hypothetical protein